MVLKKSIEDNEICILYFAVYSMFHNNLEIVVYWSQYRYFIKKKITVRIIKMYTRLLPFRVFRGPSGFKEASLTLVKLS